jgi:hypothetical protein
MTLHSPDLGPCCICEDDGAVNVVMLPHRAPIHGRGWGCVECHLPADGAVAVLCYRCIISYGVDPAALKFVCRGYPASDGRVPISELDQAIFDHDTAKHAELEG